MKLKPRIEMAAIVAYTTLKTSRMKELMKANEAERPSDDVRVDDDKRK